MPRKGEVPKRQVLPDPKYTDAPPDMRRRLTKFINVVMTDGKKSVAQNVFYDALEIIKKLERRARREVAFVHERENRNASAPANFEQLSGLTFDALAGVDDHDGRIDRGKRAVGVVGEVLVAGCVQEVEDVGAIFESHHRSGHRNAALALDLHPVGTRVPPVGLRLHLPREVDGSAGQQQVFRQRGLAGVRMRDDGKSSPPLDLTGQR